MKLAPSRLEVIKQTRSQQQFYGAPQEKAESDYPDLIELVLD